MSLRTRPQEAHREANRRATTIAIAFGRQLFEARRRGRLPQRTIAKRAGISQSTYSRIERGTTRRTPLETLVAIGVAIGRPVVVGLSRPLAAEQGPLNAGHLVIQEHVLAVGRRTGRTGTFELPTRPSDPSWSTDVGLRDPTLHVRILAECWNTIGDLGAAVRSTTRKAGEAAATWPADRIATVWVVRASAANRRLLADHPNIIDAAFPGSSRAWLAALEHGIAPPMEPGVVWFDAGRGRLTEHRRATIRR